MAEPLKIICVPWYNSSNAHQTWSGKEIILKGTCKGGTGTLKYEWDFGDGKQAVTGTVINPYAISATHIYNTGTENTIFIANLIVTDGQNNRATDTYRVKIREAENREVEKDVAVDNALWYLHTQQTRLIKNGTECGYWQSGSYYVSPTSAAIEAYGNTGRLSGGNREEDPYIETVERGFNDLWTRCKAITIGTQTAGNPDTNGNGIGIGLSSGEQTYEIGQMMLAIVGSRQPERITITGPGNVINRTYRDILQDMVDYCAFAQSDAGTKTDGRGGWQYEAYDNKNGSSDNSATQWPVIGLAAAQTEPWNIFAPKFVKDELDIWLNYSQDTDGGFGYTAPGSWKNCAKTGAGICDLAYLGYESSTPRVTRARDFLVTQWNNTSYSNEHFGNLYGMYSIMKAARLSYLPITEFGTHTWYTEYSDYLLSHQSSDGHWEQVGYLKDNISPSLATSWGILILIQSLFSAPPIAVAEVFYPQIPIVGAPVIFVGTRSYHLDPKGKIVKFEWDFENNDSIDDSGSITTHTYSQPGIYSVLLRVTDSNSSTGEDIIKIKAVVAPATVTISPGSVSIAVTKTMTITAVVKDGIGNLAEDGTRVNWSATIGSITSSSTTINGSATAIYYAPTKIGTGTITANVIEGENPTNSIPVEVTNGTLHHFNFDPIGTQTAGTPFATTITAVDSWNNTVIDFKGTVSLTNLTGTITPSIITNFKDGKYSGTVTIFNAGTVKIKADFAGKTGISNSFNVASAEVSCFRFDKIGTQTAGIGFRVNIVAYDNWGNTATTFLGGVSLSVEPYQTGTFSQGKWSGTVTIKKSGTISITAMFNDKFGTSNIFTVKPNNLDYFTLGIITTQVAGVGFPITITAYDVYGNRVEYNNIAELEDTGKTIQPVVTTNFNKGIWLGTVSISEAGTTAIKAWSGTKTGLSNVFYINTAELAYITVLPKILELTVDGIGTLTARGYDGHQNELLNFSCDWEVTPNIGYFNPEIGSNTIFTAGQSAIKGVIRAFVGNIFDTATVTICPGSLSSIIIFPNAVTTVVTGSKTFTAQGYDEYGNGVVISGKWQVVSELGILTHLTTTATTFIAGTKTGQEILEYQSAGVIGTATITLIPDVLDHFVFGPIGTQIAGQEFEITITACDKYGNIVDGFNKKSFGSLSDTSKTIMPDVISRFTSGIWTGKVYITKVIDETIITILSQGKMGISAPFKVEPSIVNLFKIEPIPTQLCHQSFAATVTAYDIYSNIVADYNGSFTLTDTTNSINKTCNFTSGTWTGTATLSKPMPDVEITVTGIKTTKSNPFFVLIDHTKDENLKEENIAIEMKAHFLPNDYYPIMIKNPTDAEVTTANYYTDKDPAVRRIPYTGYRIEARNEKRELLINGFGTESALLTLSYNQDDVDRTGIKEETLKIYELKNNRWLPLESSKVNPDENNIFASITQLGTYIIIGAIAPGDLSNFVVYPNPFKPIRGDDKIIFEGLPINTTIRIYDISGSLIRCIENVSAIYEWDVKDSHSKDVASGVYIYIVTYNDEKKTGKLAIVR
ncbi:MAG: PKD domain-containing protein [Nitrospirota bacterium]